MRKPLAVVAAALTLALVFGGCYQIRTLTWDKDKVKPGEKITMKLDLVATDNGPDGYVFLILSLAGDEGYKIKKAVFDTSDAIGEKGKMEKEPALGAANGDACESGSAREAARGFELEFVDGAFHTKNEVGDDSAKLIDAKIVVKAKDTAENGVWGTVDIGTWYDDGDGVPESDEDDWSCGNESGTAILLKGTGQIPAP